MALALWAMMPAALQAPGDDGRGRCSRGGKRAERDAHRCPCCVHFEVQWRAVAGRSVVGEALCDMTVGMQGVASQGIPFILCIPQATPTLANASCRSSRAALLRAGGRGRLGDGLGCSRCPFEGSRRARHPWRCFALLERNSCALLDKQVWDNSVRSSAQPAQVNEGWP